MTIKKPRVEGIQLYWGPVAVVIILGAWKPDWRPDEQTMYRSFLVDHAPDDLRCCSSSHPRSIPGLFIKLYVVNGGGKRIRAKLVRTGKKIRCNKMSMSVLVEEIGYGLRSPMRQGIDGGDWIFFYFFIPCSEITASSLPSSNLNTPRLIYSE